MTKKDGSCTFGLVLEQKVNNMEKATNEIKIAVSNLGDNLNGRMTELFNHQSTHVPQSIITEIKTQWKIITVLTGVVCTAISIAGVCIITL